MDPGSRKAAAGADSLAVQERMQLPGSWHMRQVDCTAESAIGTAVIPGARPGAAGVGCYAQQRACFVAGSRRGGRERGLRREGVVARRTAGSPVAGQHTYKHDRSKFTLHCKTGRMMGY